MRIRLEQFEGPLDLLLAMIEEEKLDISSISLAKVADQYLEYSFAPMDQLLYFLEIGSRLVVLKTRLLMPYLLPADDDDEGDIVTHLAKYQRYKAASRMLQGLWMTKDRTLYSARIGADFRETLTKRRKLSIAGIAPFALHKAMKRIGQKLKTASLPHTAIARKIFDIHKQVLAIKEYLAKTEEIIFSELIESAYKNEIIANFIALLELAKSRVVRLNQLKLWGEIVIEKFYAAEKPN